MQTVFKVNAKKVYPEIVQCEEPGWPNKDEFGNTMYDNVYFQNSNDAWIKLLAEHRAGVYIVWGDIRYTFSCLFHSFGRYLWYLLLLIITAIIYLISSDWRDHHE